jgi:hypothetical protein
MKIGPGQTEKGPGGVMPSGPFTATYELATYDYSAPKPTLRGAGSPSST